MDDSDCDCICNYGGVWIMASREEEMAKLKLRYAQTRGNSVETPIEKKEAPKRIAAPKVGVKLPRFDLKPYLNIIQNDVRRVMGLKSLEELEKESRYDPLLEAWKRGRNL